MTTTKEDLEAGEVHVWHSYLNVKPARLQKMQQCLSSIELERANRLVQVKHQRRSIASSGVLRHILSRYVSLHPEDLVFYYGEHGKPYLKQDELGYNLQFNMSHSGDMLLIAVTRGQECGIDVEFLGRQHDDEAVAKRFFSELENQQLLSMPENERHVGFFRCWTRKEAYIKAIGLGLSFPLNQFDVSLHDDDNCLLRVEGSREKAQKWSLVSIDVDKEHIGALAVEGEIQSLQHRQFDVNQLEDN